MRARILARTARPPPCSTGQRTGLRAGVWPWRAGRSQLRDEPAIDAEAACPDPFWQPVDLGSRPDGLVSLPVAGNFRIENMEYAAEICWPCHPAKVMNHALTSREDCDIDLAPVSHGRAG